MLKEAISEAMQAEPVFVPAHGHDKVSVFGIPVEILLTGQQTGGACSAYRISTEPGDGPPPHMHRNDDEAFYILDGRFEILCGDRTETLEAGSFVFLPRNITHTFRNVGTGTGHLLGIGTPPGHERFFEDVAALPFPPEMEAAIQVCTKHGIELVG